MSVYNVIGVVMAIGLTVGIPLAFMVSLGNKWKRMLGLILLVHLGMAALVSYIVLMLMCLVGK